MTCSANRAKGTHRRPFFLYCQKHVRINPGSLRGRGCCSRKREIFELIEALQTRPMRTGAPMSCRMILCVLAITGVMGSNEASAQRCNREGSICREQPIAEVRNNDAWRHGYRAIVRTSRRTTGCSGFDHGPVYGPRPCSFPYNCEMFDGACGKGRAWANTIGNGH